MARVLQAARISGQTDRQRSIPGGGSGRSRNRRATTRRLVAPDSPSKFNFGAGQNSFGGGSWSQFFSQNLIAP